MTGIRALIADDDPVIRGCECDRLAAMGHAFDEAGSVSEVYEKLKSVKYDYILLDMQMPMREDGTTMNWAGEICLKKIRETYTREELPVIIVTGYCVSDSRKTAELLFKNANDFLVKPAMEGEHTLEEAIRGCLETVGKGRVPQPDDTWLRREVYANHTTSWMTYTQNGLYKQDVIKHSLKANQILECIFNKYRKETVIPHQDIINACDWDYKTYYPKKGMPGRSLLKNHLGRLKENLGIASVSTEGGIRFFMAVK